MSKTAQQPFVSTDHLQDAAPDRRRLRLTLLAMCIAAFMIQLDVTIVNVALPTIQKSLGSTVGQMEWVLSGYALGLAAFIPLAGAMGDRLGHKSIFTAGLIVFGIGSIGCALGADSTTLIASRMVQGVGGAAILALTLAILKRVYPASARGRAIGTWAAVGGTGFGAGPVIGGLLLGSYGWASIFWVNIPFTALAVFLTLLAVPETRHATSIRALDGRGIFLASLGLTSLTFGLIEATSGPWSDPLTLTPIVGGFCLLVVFAWWQRHASEPLVPESLRGAPSFVGACLIYFASYTAFAGTLYYVTLLFQNIKGWSALQTGLSWLLMNIPFLIFAQLAGHLEARFSTRAIVTAGCFLSALGVATLAGLTDVPSLDYAIIGYVLSGAGFGLLVPGVTHVAMRDVPPNAAGAGSAILNCSRQLGTATGLATIGALGSAATTSRLADSIMPITLNREALSNVVSGRAIETLGENLREIAVAAFIHGYRVALTACVLCLIAAAFVSVSALRAKE